MADYKIKDIELLPEDTINGKKVADREILVILDNGTSIHITSCWESWEQWGGTNAELSITAPVADYYNDWLHGGEEPMPYGTSYEDCETETDENNCMDFEHITLQEVKNFINKQGLNLFGSRVDEVANYISKEVMEEYNEAGDGNLLKAISYVILDKFGYFDEV